jgi:hypothetical protein
LTKICKKILGQFRGNVPYGQMDEPKGKRGLISTENNILLFLRLKRTVVHANSFSWGSSIFSKKTGIDERL